jgi:hypothetical protein
VKINKYIYIYICARVWCLYMDIDHIEAGVRQKGREGGL